MKKYTPVDDAGPLESWPLDNPASERRTIDGMPRIHGRIDKGGEAQREVMA